MVISWQGNRATGLLIPQHLLESVSADSINNLLAVRLAGSETAMLGTYQLTADGVVFEPLVPFTRGLQYSIWLRNRRLDTINIPNVEAVDKPALLAIYPSQDSVPENLLKIYLHFSRPMREGQSLRYVTVLKNNTDTLPGVFLDLQPELWNADRTVLTLWLDPGRIKRDLQPNKRLGAPLQPGVRYQLAIAANWPDEQGATLDTTTTKQFWAVQRDSLSPVPVRWAIRQPLPGSKQGLGIAFGEALDYSLLTETLHIIDQNGGAVAGKWKIGKQETDIQFIPEKTWQEGTYTLRTDSRLEDLAGNNLNRLFDRDVSKKNTVVSAQPFIDCRFTLY